jgi:hypothetical protein
MAICVEVLGRTFSPVYFEYDFDLIIDGNRRIREILYVKWCEYSLIDTNHIVLLDVLQINRNHDRVRKLHFENGWTHAEFQLVKLHGEYMNSVIPEYLPRKDLSHEYPGP